MTTVTAAETASGKSHRDENFPVASHLIAPRHRGPILAFYDFVRAADCPVVDLAGEVPELPLPRVLTDDEGVGLSAQFDADEEAAAAARCRGR